jgi:ParB family chromosome partitioning protein
MDMPRPLPLDQIRDDALLRDRAVLDPGLVDELLASVLAEGLRQPIEVWALSQPIDGQRYGLISGLRRLTVFRRLAASPSGAAFATIPAFVRTPQDLPAAMAAMVSENEIRADISPWEKGALIAATVEDGVFPTPDAAVAALYPALPRQKRGRLRAFALVVEELGGTLTSPERLTVARMERLAACLRGGYAPLILDILADNRGLTLETQWAALAPVFAEAAATPADEVLPHPLHTPGRPRRLLHLRQGLTLRREWTRTGWCLHFTGPEAKKGGLMDDVIDEIERLFQRR